MIPDLGRLKSEVDSLLQEAVFRPLEGSGFFERIVGRDIREASSLFADRRLFMAVAEVLHDWGYLYLAGTKLYRTKKVPEPAPPSELASDLMEVPGRVLEELPTALEEGVRPFDVSRPENRALYLRMVDSRLYKLMLLEALSKGGAASAPPGSVVLLVGFHMGVPVGLLAPRTRSVLVAVHPNGEAVRMAEERLRALGLMREGVRLAAVDPDVMHEALRGLGGVADLVAVVDHLHWAPDPVRLLRAASSVLAPRGRVLIVQMTWNDRRMRALSLATYLMGSSVYPTASDVRLWVRTAGLRGRAVARDPMLVVSARP